MGQIYKHIDAVERDFIHRHLNEGCKLAEMTRSALFRRLRTVDAASMVHFASDI